MSDEIKLNRIISSAKPEYNTVGVRPKFGQGAVVESLVIATCNSCEYSDQVRKIIRTRKEIVVYHQGNTNPPNCPLLQALVNNGIKAG